MSARELKDDETTPMLTLTGYRTTGNQIAKSPLASDAVELVIGAGKNGWLNIAAKKASWGYHPAQDRWSYNQAPSADAEAVAQIVAAAQAYRPVSVLTATTKPSFNKREQRLRYHQVADEVEFLTGIPLDENGEY